MKCMSGEQSKTAAKKRSTEARDPKEASKRIAGQKGEVIRQESETDAAALLREFRSFKEDVYARIDVLSKAVDDLSETVEILRGPLDYTPTAPVLKPAAAGSSMTSYVHTDVPLSRKAAASMQQAIPIARIPAAAAHRAASTAATTKILAAIDQPIIKARSIAIPAQLALVHPDRRIALNGNKMAIGHLATASQENYFVACQGKSVLAVDCTGKIIFSATTGSYPLMLAIAGEAIVGLIDGVMTMWPCREEPHSPCHWKEAVASMHTFKLGGNYYLALGTPHGSIKISSLKVSPLGKSQAEMIIPAFENPATRVTALTTYVQNGDCFIVACDVDSMKIWKIDFLEKKAELTTTFERASHVFTRASHNYGVTRSVHACISQKQCLIVTNNDKSVTVWSTSGKCLYSFFLQGAHTNYVFERAGIPYVISSCPGQLHLWNGLTGGYIAALTFLDTDKPLLQAPNIQAPTIGYFQNGAESHIVAGLSNGNLYYWKISKVLDDNAKRNH